MPPGPAKAGEPRTAGKPVAAALGVMSIRVPVQPARPVSLYPIAPREECAYVPPEGAEHTYTRPRIAIVCGVRVDLSSSVGGYVRTL